MEWITIAKSSFELHSYEALLLAFLVAIFAFFFSKAIFWPTNQWPPGPLALPIIGHLHLLGNLPHQSLFKLSHTYGPLMGLHLGRIPTIVISSPRMAKEILQTHDLAFANRAHTAATRHTCLDSTDLAFSPYGPYWKFLRQLYGVELFSPKRLESIKHVLEEEVWMQSCSLMQRKGEAIMVRPMLITTSNNINCRMVMGKKVTEISTKMSSNDVLRLIEEILDLLGVFYVGDYIPWLAWLDPHGYLKRMKAIGKETKDVFQELIDKRRKTGQTNETSRQDFLDTLLAASRNEDLEVKLTDDNIIAAILDIFVGGAETSAITVEWALADLLNSPKAMKKVQEELDNVVGRERLVKESDIAHLPYLKSVIKESMRLHTIVPFLIPRESVQECHIGGYTIPPNTRAYVNIWAISRDSSTWNRPLEFWPERFDHTNLDLRGEQFILLPFGSGRRKCPGWALGFMNVHLTLASLVQGFIWDFQSSSNVVDMSEKFGITITMAKPLCAIPTPRLPLHLYKG